MTAPSRELADARMFRFARDEWLSKGRKLRRRYATAAPFPHIVIDDFLPEAVLDAVLDEFPGPDGKIWGERVHFHSAKLACNDLSVMGPVTANLIHEFNSSAFLPFLEEMTGIADIIPDTHLEGGGFHYIQRGGFLKIHADFNFHKRWRLDRRLNLLLYLNRDWREEYGGHLELWNADMTACVQRVLPAFNRCVVFDTTDTSYHGHPDPLTCPDDRGRRSLAFYYYTNGRPDEERSAAHSTMYRERPGEAPKPPRHERKRKHGLRRLGARLRDALRGPGTR